MVVLVSGGAEMPDRGTAGRGKVRRRPWPTICCSALLWWGPSLSDAAPSSSVLSRLLEGVPHVVVVDRNRYADELTNRRPGMDIEEQVMAAGVPCDRVVAVSERGFGTYQQQDGGLAYIADKLNIVAWNPLPELHQATESDRLEVSRIHAHLRAIHLALASGLDWVVILESSLDTFSTDGRDCGLTVTQLVDQLPRNSWKILQLAFNSQSPAKDLDMLSRFLDGETVRARDPRTHDLALRGTAAYAVHKRGMIDILTRHWPSSAPHIMDLAQSLAAATPESRRELLSAQPEGVFDFRLTAAAATTSSVVYGMRDAYVSTCPLWRSTDLVVKPSHWSTVDELYSEKAAARRGEQWRLPTGEALEKQWREMSSSNEATWLVLGMMVTPLPPITAPRRDRERAMQDAVKQFCDRPQPSSSESWSYTCHHHVGSLVRHYLDTSDPSPPPPSSASHAARLIFLYDSSLVHVSWTPMAHPDRGDDGSQAMLTFADMVSESQLPGVSLRQSWTSMGRHLDAIAALEDAVHRPRVNGPSPADSQRPSPASRRSPIKAFYHVAAAGPFWETIVRDQLRVMVRSGLLDIVDSVDMVMLGGARIDGSHPKIHIIDGGPNLHDFEFPTITRLADYCAVQPEARVLYLHNKGSTLSNPSSADFLPVLDWRQYMEHFVVVRHAECLEAMDRGQFDTCGVNLKPYPMQHYSGNMWWARCSFINSLPAVRSLDSSNRFAPEFWLAHTSSSEWRALSCFNVTYNMYMRRTLPQDYESAPGCRAMEAETMDLGSINSLW